MIMVEKAKEVAEIGFDVFPLGSGRKRPVYRGPFRDYSTHDKVGIENLWKDPLLSEDFGPVMNDYNIGICAERFFDKRIGKYRAMVVIDIDVDPEKEMDGFKTAKELGLVFPDTFTVQTPRGGVHHYYLADEPFSQGVELSPKGDINTRSYGGFTVGPGSEFKGKFYEIINSMLPVDLPSHLSEKLLVRKKENEKPTITGDFSLTEVSDRRVQEYLKQCEFVSEGARTTTSYKVACILKDLGCDESQTIEGLMQWNEEKCTPALSMEEIKRQAHCAFISGKNPPGSATAEYEFSEYKLPEEVKVEDENELRILKYNKEYAFCLEGGSSTILFETVDVLGKPHLDRIRLSSFHERFLPDVVQVGKKKMECTSKLWMSHPKRRTYDRVVFSPGLKTKPSEYNLWQGFTVKPLEKGEIPTQQMIDGVGAWEEHLFENACNSDPEQATWLTGYFAHLIQKPYEKPLVAPVFHGAKGVGKDSLVDRVGELLGVHYIMAGSPRLITGNFNGPLEYALLVVLNEAVGGADYVSEGIVKNLITGQVHFIERKGKEIVKARNLTRVIIMGNEDRLTNSTSDERRFTVFNMGEKRMQDTKFFKDMRVNMEAGGYRLLLTHLQDFDLSKVDINIPLETKGLHDQKRESLLPHQEWWRDSLFMGRILGTTDSTWPEEISAESLRQALKVRHQDLNIRSPVLNEVHLGKFLKKLGLEHSRKQSVYTYKLKSLEESRKDWDEYLRVTTDWEE